MPTSDIDVALLADSPSAVAVAKGSIAEGLVVSEEKGTSKTCLIGRTLGLKASPCPWTNSPPVAWGTTESSNVTGWRCLGLLPSFARHVE